MGRKVVCIEGIGLLLFHSYAGADKGVGPLREMCNMMIRDVAGVTIGELEIVCDRNGPVLLILEPEVTFRY